jgi:hypothetical protein
MRLDIMRRGEGVAFGDSGLLETGFGACKMTPIGSNIFLRSPVFIQNRSFYVIGGHRLDLETIHMSRVGQMRPQRCRKGVLVGAEIARLSSMAVHYSHF